METGQPKKITVNIERGGEYIQTTCNEGDTVQALIQDGHLRGIEVTSTRVNGAPAKPSTPLREGDTVTQIPRSGRQG